MNVNPEAVAHAGVKSESTYISESFGSDGGGSGGTEELGDIADVGCCGMDDAVQVMFR